MKVLIIDDDQDLTAIFVTILKKEGFEMLTAQDGNTGIAKIKAENPDLILLDQVLPDISGNDILKKVKDDPSTAHIPVIILSNFSQKELVDEALTHGAVEYIFKYQISPMDLVGKVKEILNKKEDLPAGRQEK